MDINLPLTTKKSERLRPLVSVIMPVFNGASYLEEAVESVQKSTFRNFEILLIDDKSEDHSKKICRMLVRKYSNVKFYAFSQNKGLGRVLNFALKKAHGIYICRLNQDDRMLAFRMHTQVFYLQQNKEAAAVGSWIKLFYSTGKYEIIKFLENDKDIKKVWHIVSPFSDPSVMYRKDIALQAGGYKQEFWPADDTHLWYRMGLIGKLYNIQEPLVEVRWHEKAASVLYFRKLVKSTYKMHRFANSHIDQAPLIIQIYWIIQLLCGLILSPSFNWKVYRVLKRIIAFLNTKMLPIVNIQPKPFKISGV